MAAQVIAVCDRYRLAIGREQRQSVDGIDWLDGRCGGASTTREIFRFAQNDNQAAVGSTTKHV